MSAPSDILVQLLILLLAVFFVRRWKQQHHIAKCLSRLPGFTYSLPIIGDMLRLPRDHATILTWGCSVLHQHGPNLRFWMCTSPIVVLTKLDDIEIILSNPKNIYKPLYYYRMLEYFFGRGLITLVGDEWRKHRKAITPSFHFGVLEKYVNIFLDRAEHLNKQLSNFSDGSAFDVSPFIGACSNETICATALGLPSDGKSLAERLEFLNDMSTSFTIMQYRVLHPWLMSDILFAFTPKARILHAADAKIKDYAEKAIKTRKEDLVKMTATGKDQKCEDDDVGMRQKYSFLDLMLTGSNVLTSAELVGEVRTLIAAQQTSAVLSSFALQMLAMHPEIQEKAFVELERVWSDSSLTPHQRLQSLHCLDRIIKETLRLFPSVPGFAREIFSDTTLTDGTQLPAGCCVAIFVFAIHRDPKIYPDPLKFDPDRFLPENFAKRHPFSYLPFGAGSRNCIGQKYAILQIKAVLSTILRQFQLIAPEDGPKTVADVRVSTDTFLTSRDGHRICLRNRSSAVKTPL